MLTPKQFKQRVQLAFANSWALCAGYIIVGTAISVVGKRADRREQAELIAEALAPHFENTNQDIHPVYAGEELDPYVGNDDHGEATDPLKDMVAFTDTNGTDWFKNAAGKWVNLDA
ncbi:hypothetical protein [Corynebacterium sp. A21]|uniref:hypothetical protein n=1 Tax=Corynebacterium sp. A21 TaxID=3457318 RepID=UPI003FD58A0D